MGIGASVFLIAVGLILALAVDLEVSGIDLVVVGWILVAAGVLGLIMSFALWGPRRRRVTTVDRTGVIRDPADPDARIVRERAYDDGPV
jgi:hypothetical protein